MSEQLLTVTLLSSVAGGLLSLALEYIPGLASKYATLEEGMKRIVMGLLLLIATIFIFVASCYTPYVYVACSEAGFLESIQILVTALLAGAVPGNQATHSLLKRTK